MKRVLGLVMVFGAASFAVTDANPRTSSFALAATIKPNTKASGKAMPAKHVTVAKISVADLAPADEYFGPLKQSIVGINNTIRDLGLRYDVNHDIGPQTIASAALTESAIKDWQKRYPKDDQLPRSIYFLQRLYAKILTDAGRAKAKATSSWMFVSFGASPQAKMLHKMLVLDQQSQQAAAPTAESSQAPAAATSTAPLPGASAPVPATATSAGPGFVTPAPAAPGAMPAPSASSQPAAAVFPAGTPQPTVNH